MLNYAQNRVIVALACVVIWLGVVESRQPRQHYTQAITTNHAVENAKQVSPTDITNERLATYTMWLAIFTGALSLSSFFLWWVTRKSTRVAERALTDLERPYLFILDYNWLLIDLTKPGKPEVGWTYTVANGGRLPAIIRRVCAATRFGHSIPTPVEQPPIHELLTAPLIAGGEQRSVIERLNIDERTHECEIRGGMAHIPASAFKTEHVITKISIEYDGPITTGHITTACWEWHPVKHAFTQYGDIEHNQRT